ncbi:MAG TPA: hypothetical protein VFP20_01090 [Bacteroidales bacterium]|nr:hypothetical protein [Bacteroidales bacterium]
MDQVALIIIFNHQFNQNIDGLEQLYKADIVCEKEIATLKAWLDDLKSIY